MFLMWQVDSSAVPAGPSQVSLSTSFPTEQPSACSHCTSFTPGLVSSWLGLLLEDWEPRGLKTCLTFLLLNPSLLCACLCCGGSFPSLSCFFFFFSFRFRRAWQSCWQVFLLSFFSLCPDCVCVWLSKSHTCTYLIWTFCYKVNMSLNSEFNKFSVNIEKDQSLEFREHLESENAAWVGKERRKNMEVSFGLNPPLLPAPRASPSTPVIPAGSFYSAAISCGAPSARPQHKPKSFLGSPHSLTFTPGEKNIRN